MKRYYGWKSTDQRANHFWLPLHISHQTYFYYIEKNVLLGTKPLVDSVRHFIRDPSGVFSVCHLSECRIIQWRHDSRLLLSLNWFLASCLVSLDIIKRTLHVGEKIWILCSRGKILFLPLEHKVHIFLPPCNILYLLTRWETFAKIDFERNCASGWF